MKWFLIVIFGAALFASCGETRDEKEEFDETPTTTEKESSADENGGDEETDKPLSDLLLEQGLPVLLEYAKLLSEFEQREDNSPGSLLDLAFSVANTAQKLAIDVLPVEEGWQDNAGDRFHEYMGEECELIEDNRRLSKIRGVLAKMKKANGLDGIFSVYLIKDKENNAFSSVGGRLYLTTGMLKFLRNDDELAWVLGHEMAHLTCGHCDRKAKMLHLAGGFGDIVETGASVGLMLTAPFGQGDEYEADSKGRQYAKDAGYDPGAAVEVLRRFKQDEGAYDDLEKMFRSHPFSEERINQLEK